VARAQIRAALHDHLFTRPRSGLGTGKTPEDSRGVPFTLRRHDTRAKRLLWMSAAQRPHYLSKPETWTIDFPAQFSGLEAPVSRSGGLLAQQ